MGLFKILFQLVKTPSLLIREKSRSATLFRSTFLAVAPTVLLFFALAVFHVKIQQISKIIAINSIIFGFLLIVADRWGARHASGLITEKKALLIGLLQFLSAIPGVSRLGICLTTARFLSLGRKESLMFSCLTGIPILFLAGAYSALGCFAGSQPAPPSINFFTIILSFALGYLSLRAFIRYIENCAFVVFGVYRIVFGLFLLFL
jgi:undecaprenyl-diphosphatase